MDIQKNQLEQRLHEIGARNARFSQLGPTTAFAVGEIELPTGWTEFTFSLGIGLTVWLRDKAGLQMPIQVEIEDTNDVWKAMLETDSIGFVVPLGD